MNWDAYFIDLAKSVASYNCSCLKRKVGAVLVRSDNSVIATGYNGAPQGVTSCGHLGHCRRDDAPKTPDRYEHCIAVHAEQNCLMFAAKHGVIVNGAKIYLTHTPCTLCLRLLIQAGIKEIIYADALDYTIVNNTYDELKAEVNLRQFIKS